MVLTDVCEAAVGTFLLLSQFKRRRRVAIQVQLDALAVRESAKMLSYTTASLSLLYLVDCLTSITLGQTLSHAPPCPDASSSSSSTSSDACASLFNDLHPLSRAIPSLLFLVALALTARNATPDRLVPYLFRGQVLLLSKLLLLLPLIAIISLALHAPRNYQLVVDALAARQEDDETLSSDLALRHVYTVALWAGCVSIVTSLAAVCASLLGAVAAFETRRVVMDSQRMVAASERGERGTTRHVMPPSPPPRPGHMSEESDGVHAVLSFTRQSLSTLLMSHMHRLLSLGALRQISMDDLPHYPPQCHPATCAKELYDAYLIASGVTIKKEEEEEEGGGERRDESPSLSTTRSVLEIGRRHVTRVSQSVQEILHTGFTPGWTPRRRPPLTTTTPISANHVPTSPRTELLEPLSPDEEAMHAQEVSYSNQSRNLSQAFDRVARVTPAHVPNHVRPSPTPPPPQTPRRRLIIALLSLYGRTYLSLGGLKFLNDSLNFAGPLLLHELVLYLQTPDDHLPTTGLRSSKQYGLLLALALGSTALCKALLGTQYSYRTGLLACRLKASLAGTLFRQSLGLVLEECGGGYGAGAIQTMMAVDTDRVTNLVGSLHELWALPLQILVALCFLYQQVTFSFLSGLAVVALLIPINRALAVRIRRASAEAMSAKDERLEWMTQLVSRMRDLKASNAERLFLTRIQAARERELKALRVKKYLDALCVYFWAATSLLFSVFTFGAYALSGRKLTPQIAFTALALFNILIGPLNSFPWVVNGVVEAWVSLGRLEDFLRNGMEEEARRKREGDRAAQREVGEEAAVVLRNASFKRHETHAMMQSTSLPLLVSSPPLLHHVSLSLPFGSFCIVTGSPGGGKSALLAALAGELVLTEGQVMLHDAPPPTPMAPPSPHARRLSTSSSEASSYSPAAATPLSVVGVPQRPWLSSGTVRDNILMGRPLFPRQYRKVLAACALEPDLKQWKDGDLMYVGDGGGALSVGQRFRITLARALYAAPSLLLVDDGLSSLDSTVATFIIEHVFVRGRRGSVVEEEEEVEEEQEMPAITDLPPPSSHDVPLLPPHCVVILVSQSTAARRFADCVLWIEHGQLTHQDVGGGGGGGGGEGFVHARRITFPSSSQPLLPTPMVASEGKRLQNLWAPLEAKNDSIVGNKEHDVLRAANWDMLATGLVKEYESTRDNHDGEEDTRAYNTAEEALMMQDSLVLAPSAAASRAATQFNATQQATEMRGTTALPRPTSFAWLAYAEVDEQQHGDDAVTTATTPFWSLAAPRRVELEGFSDSDAGSPRAGTNWSFADDFGPTLSSTASPLPPPLPTTAPANLAPQHDDDEEEEEAADLTHPTSRGNLPLTETRLRGHVSRHVYWLYLLAAGPWLSVVVLLSLLLMQLSRNGTDLFIAYWAAHAAKHPSLDYLALLIAFALGNSLLTLIRAFSFANGGMHAARRIHELLLSSLLRAPASFFDAHPRGRILNRFSSDTTTIDDSVPFILNIFLANFAAFVGITIVMLIAQPIMLLLLIPLSIMYMRLQRYYRQTSREVRRLDATSKSPIYALFSEVLDGLASIRGAKAVDCFQSRAEETLAGYQRASVAGLGVSQWLAVRLQLISAAVIFMLAALVVWERRYVDFNDHDKKHSKHHHKNGTDPNNNATTMTFLHLSVSSWMEGEAFVAFAPHHYNHDSVAASFSPSFWNFTFSASMLASLVGLSLSYALPLTNLLNGLLTSSAETEQELVALERVAEYIEECSFRASSQSMANTIAAKEATNPLLRGGSPEGLLGSSPGGSVHDAVLWLNAGWFGGEEGRGMGLGLGRSSPVMVAGGVMPMDWRAMREERGMTRGSLALYRAQDILNMLSEDESGVMVGGGNGGGRMSRITPEQRLVSLPLDTSASGRERASAPLPLDQSVIDFAHRTAHRIESVQSRVLAWLSQTAVVAQRLMLGGVVEDSPRYREERLASSATASSLEAATVNTDVERGDVFGLEGSFRAHRAPSQPFASVHSSLYPTLQRGGGGNSIVFEHVWMRYSPLLPWSLQDVSLTVHGASRAVIIGRTGAGKSSLIAALLGLYPIQHGRILIGNRDIRLVPREQLLSMVAVVPQVPLVVEASLLENIDPSLSLPLDHLVRVVKSVGLDVWMAEVLGVSTSGDPGRFLPPPCTPPASPTHSFHSTASAALEPVVASANQRTLLLDEQIQSFLLDKRHATLLKGLSHGRRQLVALARALARRPRVLILDEFTSSLDDLSAVQLQDLVHASLIGTTVLQIAHKVHTMRAAHVTSVFEMVGGRVVERGGDVLTGMGMGGGV